VVTLREAVSQGISPRRLPTLNRASTREAEFPVPVGHRGSAGLYDAVELAEYERCR
jgi:hypothetical protein